MKFPIYQIDAFTNRVFRGNPAAVVVLDEWLDDQTLQAIAAENNLAETAFVIPQATCSKLRWFTPAVEVELCGHALATRLLYSLLGQSSGQDPVGGAAAFQSWGTTRLRVAG